jgi:hypothetical protein
MSFESVPRHTHVGIIDDVIAAVDALGAVASVFHRDRAGHASALEVPGCRSTKIMSQHLRASGVLPRRLPRFLEILDALAPEVSP